MLVKPSLASLSVYKRLPVATFHIFTVLSCDAEASRFPSGLNATANTASI